MIIRELDGRIVRFVLKEELLVWDLSLNFCKNNALLRYVNGLDDEFVFFGTCAAPVIFCLDLMEALSNVCTVSHCLGQPLVSLSLVAHISVTSGSKIFDAQSVVSELRSTAVQSICLFIESKLALHLSLYSAQDLLLSIKSCFVSCE